MKVTARTIAEELNISTATVDRALHNRGGVSPKTIKKVMEKAKELNYKPNKSASFLAKGKDIRVAFVFPEHPEYFWKDIELGINSALVDIQDYGFYADIVRTPLKIEKQIEVVKNLINSGDYHGLAFSPLDASPFIDVINEAIDNGFPIYLFNNDSNSSNRLSFVGPDYTDSGRLAGELLYKFTGSSKKFALISDDLETLQMKEKIIGFKEYISKFKEIEFFGPLKVDPTNLTTSIQRLEKNLKDIDGIYVAGGTLANVADEITKMNLNKKPKLVGHDMSEEIFSYLDNEVVTATVCQDPIYQGNLAARTVFNHLMLEHEIEDVKNIVKLEIVTKGNAKYYL